MACCLPSSRKVCPPTVPVVAHFLLLVCRMTLFRWLARVWEELRVCHWPATHLFCAVECVLAGLGVGAVGWNVACGDDARVSRVASGRCCLGHSAAVQGNDFVSWGSGVASWTKGCHEASRLSTYEGRLRTARSATSSPATSPLSCLMCVRVGSAKAGLVLVYFFAYSVIRTSVAPEVTLEPQLWLSWYLHRCVSSCLNVSSTGKGRVVQITQRVWLLSVERTSRSALAWAPSSLLLTPARVSSWTRNGLGPLI